MPVVEVLWELGDLHEVVVTPTISHNEWGTVLFADCLASGVEAD